MILTLVTDLIGHNQVVFRVHSEIPVERKSHLTN